MKCRTRPPSGGSSRPPAWRIAPLAVSLAIATSNLAAALPVNERTLVTNGPVHVMSRDGDRLYIGGEFSLVGVATGGAVLTDAVTGEVVQVPQVAGSVGEVVSDGAGGWFLGGSFTHIGGVPRTNLAHLRADGTLSDWAPSAPGGITAMAATPERIYFSYHAYRAYLGFVDRQTAEVGSLPVPTVHQIHTLAISGTTLFVGSFGMYEFAGRWMAGVMAISLPDHQLLPGFDPRADIYGQHQIYALAANETTLFVGGYFGYFGGVERYGIAALDARTGAALPWHTESRYSQFAVNALILRDSTLYVGGGFTRLGDADRPGLAALDIRTGLARDWNPPTAAASGTLASDGATLYGTGWFGGRSWDLTTGAARGWTLAADPGIGTIAATPTRVLVGGGFTMFESERRYNAAAIHLGTGEVLSWAPVISEDVLAIHPVGATVYVGGKFSKVNGVRRPYLAAVDAATGALLPWDPVATQYVHAFASDQATLWVGGAFGTLQGQPRSMLGAFDLATGALLPWNPAADDVVRGLATGDGVVYAGGDFTTIGGQARNRLAALDPASGAATAWNPDVNNDVTAIAVHGSRLYAAGWFTKIGGQRRGRMAAIDLATGLPTLWNPQANEAVRAFAIAGSSVYLAGDFDSLAGQQRRYIGSVDLETAAPSAWAPNLSSTLRSIVAVPGTVFAGGYFYQQEGFPRPYFTAIVDDHSTPVLLARFEASGTSGGIAVRWRLAGEEPAVRISLERAEGPEGPWRVIAAEVRREGEDEVAIDLDVEPGRTYYYRLRAESAEGLRTFGPLSASALTAGTTALVAIGPNPAAGATAIDFVLAYAGPVRLSVLDVGGRSVAQIVSATLPAGRHRATWNGAGARGKLSPGLYFVRFEALDRVTTRKLAIVR